MRATPLFGALAKLRDVRRYGHLPVLPKDTGERQVLQPAIRDKINEGIAKVAQISGVEWAPLGDYAKVHEGNTALDGIFGCLCPDSSLHEPDAATRENALIESHIVDEPAIGDSAEEGEPSVKLSVGRRLRDIYRRQEARLARAPGSLDDVPLERVLAATNMPPTPRSGGSRAPAPPAAGPTSASLDIGMFRVARTGEVAPDVGARHVLATLASIKAEELRISFGDALRIVSLDPANAQLVEALEPGRNAYARDDAVTAAVELNNLALERARSEKLTYKDALRAVSAEHPELEDARDAQWRRY